MAIVNILAFCALALLLSLKWKERIVDVLPLAACILILILYVLAFFRRLSAIDWIGSVFLLVVMGCFLYVCRKKDARKQALARIGKELFHPGVIVALLVFVGTALLVRGRIATWWDDLNFWATDVKAIWALDGFAAKYTNAAPEFGDYPPGVQLMKWWFVHMKPDRFSEGLMFAGYYFCVFVFLMPLLRRMKGKNPLFLLLAAVCLWAFPSVAEVFYCQGMCADLVMAVVYGAFLSAVLDEKGHEKSFYYARLALYLAVLVLVKSVGFLWAAFGLVFLWVWKWNGLRAARTESGAARTESGAAQAESGAVQAESGAAQMKSGAAQTASAQRGKNGAERTARRWRALLPMLLVTAAPALSGGSWLLFCLLMRRVAKLTGSALFIASGNLPILLPGTRSSLVAAFLEAFAVWPLHRGRTLAIDFSPLALFLLICALIFWFWRRSVLTKAEAKLLGIFLPVSGLIFYGIDLVSHLTIFATETQYLEPFAMVSSIERYGAPFAVGSLYLLAFLLLERKETVQSKALSGNGFLQKSKIAGLWQRDGVYLICFAFVIISANWTEVYNGLHGYRAEREEALADRAAMITEESEQFLKLTETLDAGSGMRILYLKDAAVSQWVKNTYVAYEASPVSLVFGSIDCATMNSGDVWNAMDASHAGYLYMDEIPGNVSELFSPFTEEIQAHTLYRIIKEDGAIRLEKTVADETGAKYIVSEGAPGGEEEAGVLETEPAELELPGMAEGIWEVDEAEAPCLESGGVIALVISSDMAEDAEFNEEAWKGVLAYADAADITCSVYRADAATQESCEAALVAAVENQAKIVICAGPGFEQAVGSLQNQYEEIGFLLLDGVVKDASGREETAADNVHCVTYREDEAGYLAGYTAVLEGYRRLGFIGGEQLPFAKEYGYGYLQGIDAAAKYLEAEDEIRVDYWYADAFENSKEAETVSDSWYREGTELIFVCGDTLYEPVLASAEACGGKLIGADTDQSSVSELFLTSAMKGIGASVVLTLDEFFASGAGWPEEMAGRVVSYGVEKKCVGLPVTEDAWRFENVSEYEYFQLLGAMRDGRIAVSDDVSRRPETAVQVIYHNK